jgi:hypothetical protein
MPNRLARRSEESSCLHMQDQAAVLRLKTLKSQQNCSETRNLFILSDRGRYEHFTVRRAFRE